jgi:hypothetical protein
MARRIRDETSGKCGAIGLVQEVSCSIEVLNYGGSSDVVDPSEKRS